MRPRGIINRLGRYAVVGMSVATVLVLVAGVITYATMPHDSLVDSSEGSGIPELSANPSSSVLNDSDGANHPDQPVKVVESQEFFASIKPVEKSLSRLLTEEEVQPFVDLINAGLAKGDVKPLSTLFDISRFNDIALRSYSSVMTPLLFEIRKKESGLTIAARLKRSVINRIDDAVHMVKTDDGHRLAGDTEFKFLRLGELDGYRSALFRLRTRDGGFDHQAFLFAEVRGQIRIVDVYLFSAGERMSHGLRFNFLSTALEDDPIFSMVGIEGEFGREFSIMGEMSRAVRSGDAEKALKLYGQLPQPLKRYKLLLALRLSAARMLISDDEIGAAQNTQLYLDAISDLEKYYPGDGALPTLKMRFAADRGDLDGVLEAIDTLDELVGGDPYLLVLRAEHCFSLAQTDRAKQLLHQAIEADPQMPASYYLQMGMGYEEGDKDAMLASLKSLFDLGMVMDKEQLDSYELLDTPQYEEYLEYISK